MGTNTNTNTNTMSHNEPTEYEQTRPPELRWVPWEGDDDWTFSVNVQYHHAYPDLKGYRRNSNGVTPGDIEAWHLRVRVHSFGRAKFHVDFPPAQSRWTSEYDGIWACPIHHVEGFSVFAMTVDETDKFVKPDGGFVTSITADVACTRPGAQLNLELSCPDKREGDFATIIFWRNVLWDTPPNNLDGVFEALQSNPDKEGNCTETAPKFRSVPHDLNGNKVFKILRADFHKEL